MDTIRQCSAKSKQTGKRCKNFAIKGKTVCRFHGGVSTGPKTKEGKQRIKKALTKHGLYSVEAVEERRIFRKNTRLLKEELEDIMAGRLTY